MRASLSECKCVRIIFANRFLFFHVHFTRCVVSASLFVHFFFCSFAPFVKRQMLNGNENKITNENNGRLTVDHIDWMCLSSTECDIEVFTGSHRESKENVQMRPLVRRCLSFLYNYLSVGRKMKTKQNPMQHTNSGDNFIVRLFSALACRRRCRRLCFCRLVYHATKPMIRGTWEMIDDFLKWNKKKTRFILCQFNRKLQLKWNWLWITTPKKMR